MEQNRTTRQETKAKQQREQKEMMQRRIKLMGAVFVGLLVFLAGYLGGMMLPRDNNLKRIAELEATVQKLDLAAHGLDENGVSLTRMASFYKDRDPYGVSLAENDAEFRQYCQEHYPEAVCPATEWTVEEVLQSYVDSPEIWGYWRDSYTMSGFYFTWTQDYEHCFMLDFGYSIEPDCPELTSGWLCVDGVRVQNFDQEVGPVEPLELIEAYQKGEWDGSQRLSADRGTRVYVGSDGMLNYYYTAYQYNRTIDPEKLAYTGYEEPWWVAEDLDPKVAAAMADAEHYPFDGTNDVFAYGSVDVRLYVDFPLGYDTKGFYETRRRDAIGTFALTHNRVLLAKAGQVLEEWDLGFEVGEAKFLMSMENPEPAYAKDVVYLYTDERVLALREDGEVAVMLEKVFDYSDTAQSMWGFQGDQLFFWDAAWAYESESPVLVADGVLEIDFSRLRLVRRADGCYAIVQQRKDDNWVYELEYLGEEGLDYYTEFFQSLEAAKVYRW